jgi:curved DNA-binding protein CbpA
MNATEQQIMSLYHYLARLNHPDCQPNNLSKDDANRTLALINNANEILGNAEKRREYAASLRIGEAGDEGEEGNDDEDRDDDKDSDDDDDSNGDGFRSPDKDSNSCPCDWAHVFNFCYCPQLQPLKCTTVGCANLSIKSVNMYLIKDIGTERLPC